MLRTSLLAALLLLAGCAPSPELNQGPGLTPRSGVGVLVKSTRGRCTRVVTGDHQRRVCLPRLGKPEPGDTIRADTTAADPG